MSTIDQLRTAISGRNVSYIQHAFAKAEDQTIGELLNSLNKDRDSKLTVDEIIDGIEKYCSSFVRAGLADGNFLNRASIFLNLGGNKKEPVLKPETRAQIKKELEASIGKYIDINRIKNVGLNLDLIKVEDIFDALDWLKEVCNTNIPEKSLKAYNAFKAGNYGTSLKSAASAGKTYFQNNFSDSSFRDKSAKAHATVAKYVGNKVREHSWGWVGDVAEWITETNLNLHSGVTFGNWFGK